MREPSSASKEFSQANDRLRRLLRRNAVDLDDGETPTLTEAVAAAAKAVGAGQRIVEKPRPQEPDGDAIVRIARSSGLITRETRLSADSVGSAPVPLLALRILPKGGREPVLLQRTGRRWRVASAQDGWRFRSLRRFNPVDFEEIAYAILPALPDGHLSPYMLLKFGMPQSAIDLGSLAVFTVIAGSGIAALPLLSGPLFNSVIPENDDVLLLNMVLFFSTLFVVNLLGRLAAGIAELRYEGRTGYFVRAAAIDRAVRVASQMERNGVQMPPAPIYAFSAESLAHWHRGVWGLVIGSLSGLLIAAPSVAAVATSSPSSAFLLAATVFLFAFGGLAVARQRVRAILASRGHLQSWMVTAFETLSMIETIRATASESRMYLKWTQAFAGSRSRMLRGDRIGAVSNALGASASSAITLAAIFAMALAGGVASDAQPAILIVAAGGLASAVSSLLAALEQATMLAVQYRMIRPLMDSSPEPTSLGAPPPTLAGQVECERLTVRYRPGGAAAISDVSLSIAAGEHVGLVGSSGAGKSTLAKALIGLAPIEQGTVRFDGLDIAFLDDRALRRQIGTVGQSGRLFPGTLYENVAGGHALDHAAVEAALAKAGLMEDVANLPLGLATPLNDSTTTLSGGQIQRVLLARAFAVQPRVLILDEATSALDPDLQARISDAVDAMGITVITIAHRLETLRRCDRIVVLEGGRLVETGVFSDLASNGGRFAELLAAETVSIDVP